MQESASGSFQRKSHKLCFLGLKIEAGKHLYPSVRQVVTAPDELTLPPAVVPKTVLTLVGKK